MKTSKNFTQAEYDQFQEVMKFVLNKASWSLSTKEALELNRHLAFLNTINSKIKEHILEIIKVHEANDDVPTT